MSHHCLNPEVYKQGRGRDAYNQLIQEICNEKHTQHEPHKPTRVWIDENNTPDGVVSSLNIILNTGGCTLRGYVAESVDDGSVNHDVIMNQIDLCLEHETAVIDQPADLVKIYTSGSFLDEHEVSMKSRVAITETFADRDRIVIESSPDFVNREKLRTFTEVGLATDVAIRVETATDRIRHDCINEYFDFTDSQDACAEVCHANDMTPSDVGVGVRGCLLLKPPFLTESEAVDDMVESVRQCANINGCHTVSMNSADVQRYTVVDTLFSEDGYRPPWL